MTETHRDHPAVTAPYIGRIDDGDRMGDGDALVAIADAARQLGADEVLRDAGAVAARLSASRFYAACVGQFKRGKSALINALLGAPILPTGVLPVTNLITIVRFGERQRAVVRFPDGAEREISPAEIGGYVSEAQNPHNCKGAALVEVEVPSPLLATGMCLVDTPGLGSLFGESSDTTRRFVPHIDVALLVTGADPPLSGHEAALAEEVGRETPHCLVVLNKADRMSDADVREAASFTLASLEGSLGRTVELFVVSASERLTRDWSRLERRLTQLSNVAGDDLVRAARARAVRRLGGILLREIDAHRAALLEPIDDTGRRLVEIQRRVATARRALDDLTFLFASEQQKLSQRFAAERDRFLSGIAPVAASDEAALRAAREAIESWLREVEPEAERLFAASTGRFVDLLREMGDSDDLRPQLVRRRFYFTALPELSAPSLFRKRDPRAYLRRLLETNSARVMNDLIDRVVESRRQLESEVRSSLRDVVSGAERTAQHERAAREARRQRVSSEIARLDTLAAEIRTLRSGEGQ